MAIEKHLCEGGDFHTTTDFLDCADCDAVIPQPKDSDDIVTCGSCGSTNYAHDLADARVEEIVAAVANGSDPEKAVPEGCLSIGESRIAELEDKERRCEKLEEQVKLLRKAVKEIEEIPLETDGLDAGWERSGCDSEEILCRVIRLARNANKATKET